MRLIDLDTVNFEINISDESNKRIAARIIEEVMGHLNELPTIDKLYGYNINDLIAFAIACRRQGITEEDLYAFSQEMSNAYKCVYNEINDLVQDQFKEVMSSYNLEKEL